MNTPLNHSSGDMRETWTCGCGRINSESTFMCGAPIHAEQTRRFREEQESKERRGK